MNPQVKLHYLNLKKLLTFGNTSDKIIFAVGNDRNTKETTLKNVKINLKKLLTNEKQSVIMNNRCGQKSQTTKKFLEN